jgi:hypothetical protein
VVQCKKQKEEIKKRMHKKMKTSLRKGCSDSHRGESTMKTKKEMKRKVLPRKQAIRQTVKNTKRQAEVDGDMSENWELVEMQ